MRKSDRLFSLIRSLTSSEKRYFKLATGFHGQDQNYLALFDAMDQMENYHEATLRSQFSDKVFAKQLHVAKNYLGKLIMKSLRAYHLKESVNARLKARLIDIEILYKKDLLRSCYSSICGTEKLAIRLGDELALLEILNWKRKVLLNMKGITDGKITLDNITNQEQNILKSLGDESSLWELTLNISSPSRDSMESYRKHPLLKNATRANTHRSKILHYHLSYVTHTMSSNPKKAEKSLDQLITYLESEPLKLKDDPAPYVTALNNKIGLYLNQRKHDLIPPLLKSIRNVPERFKLKASSPISMKLLIRTYNVELETYRDSGQTDRALKMIPKTRAFINKHGDLISREYIILFHYQFAYLYFIEGDFKRSLKDVNQVLNQRNFIDRSDIIGYAQFLNLIIHYELGNFTVMKYSVDASRRFLKKRGSLQEFEKVLLSLFSRLSTRPESQHLQIMEKCFHRLFDGPPVINESQLDYLDFKYWLSSKLNITFNKH